MKEYTSLGELLQDYREDNNLSQADFSGVLNIDIRTLQRWEKDHTLIKPEKEDDIVLKTLLPYQLIRNLNAAVPIPTYYDFRIRKYSLTPLTTEIPDASWLKEDINNFFDGIFAIRDKADIDLILRDIQLHNHSPSIVSKELIKEAIKLLPELNLIITDDSGYYAGHSLVFPINAATFKKLKNREISEEALQIKDLVNPKNQEQPIFYNYDITADCNDHIFYIAHQYLNFFVNLQKVDYYFCAFSIRHDSYHLNEQLGLKLVWEDKKAQKERALLAPPRFYTGDFKEFLSDK